MIEFLKKLLAKLEGDAAAELEKELAALSSLEHRLTQKVAAAEGKASYHVAQAAIHAGVKLRAEKVAANIRALIAA